MVSGPGAHIHFAGRQLFESRNKEDKQRILETNSVIAEELPCQMTVEYHKMGEGADEVIFIIERAPFFQEGEGNVEMAEYHMRNILGDRYLGTGQDYAKPKS